MGSLVREMQQDALNSAVSVSDLLRKALVVSTKLQVDSEREWIRWELFGYPADDNSLQVESYRVLHGKPEVFNPFRGYMPLHMSAELQEAACTIHLGFSVAEIEALLEKHGSMIRMGFNPKAANALMRAMQYPLEPSMVLSATLFSRILDTVRNRVLQWALGLEEAGILGDGLSFTSIEVQAAKQVTHITNNIGSMTNSQIQQLSSGEQSYSIEQNAEALTSLLREIKNAAASTGEDERVSLNADTILLQLRSSEPNHTVIGECLRSLKTVIEGAAGGALGNYLPALLGLMNSIGLS
ncbi:hypothetical protein [Stenotrophomonas sp.]|uniref:AbiTii domain-containing protein n=1 Tax=Stenotrophomonas sp. TaxID=69392 RepID=UPI0028AA8248|nr:hypothetical protein [Stenotrophomonas sp.]